MSAPWLPGQAITVIGAAHQRQGKPCQDSSLCSQIKAGSETLQLLAVADGHGGSRYWLSDVGSRIACIQAEQAVRQVLAQTPLADHAGWLKHLRDTLPEQIHSAWLTAVERDWQQRPEAIAQPFSALRYGCTLGLVLLTPQWWGCGGLGDWDLAAVAADRTAQLLSEELGGTGGSEATGSLCQPRPEQRWAERAQLQPLSADPARALVLSTDGVRKSCATDADYLHLCAALVELNHQELEEGLQQITAEGSGDDVSVAIALRPLAIQQPERGPKHRIRWAIAAPVALLIAAGIGVAIWRRLHPPDPLAQLIGELCRGPERIRPTLTQRRSQFAALLNQPDQRAQLKAQAAKDPLGALIAGSTSASSPSCLALKQELQRQWAFTRAQVVPTKGKMPATAPSPP